MKRPWQVWLVFGACVVGAAAAMVGLTRQALEADRLRRAAVAEAELEQRVSLALWRIDTELAPLVAEQVIRPPAAYRIAEAAVNEPAQQMQQAESVPVAPPPYVVLYFEARPDGGWHSPQESWPVYPTLPGGPKLTPLAKLSQSVELLQLLAKLPSASLPPLAAIGSNFEARNLAQSPTQFNELANQLQFFEGNEGKRTEATKELPPEPMAKSTSTKQGKAADLEQRGLRYQTAAQQSLMNQQRAWSSPDPLDGSREPLANEQIGVMRPVWLGERLVLARRAGLNGETVVQGCWLDWPLLKTRLLAEAVDLLPDADLLPVLEDASGDPGRMLAGLPVRLAIGPALVGGTTSPTLRWSLWMGWGALAVATLAAAALLFGVMALSERRAAFVSSVTHELRTPLTTFRLYSEMLARGMVPDAAKRQEYLHTLQREAERLTLLVENVLAYARLERGRKPTAADRVTIVALLERIAPRLEHRAAQADMKCDVQIANGVEGQEIVTDLNVVEQILFNLVDNAAKYARAAADRRIHVEASRDGNWVRLAVRDHGPGIEPSRPMRAFGKTAEQSAESAPGVGLGLALCRRLATQLGGRLEIAAARNGGAVVTLMLKAE